MRNKPSMLMICGALILALLVAFLVFHFKQRSGASAATPPTFITMVCPGASLAQRQGVRGITPRNDCTPSFPASDITTFFAQHGYSFFKIESMQAPTGVTIDLATVAGIEAQYRLSHGELGLPENTIIYYMTAHGLFQGDSPGGLSISPDRVEHVVFDAHTGNILLTRVGQQ